MSDRLSTRIGRVALKNPFICGSGEHVMEEAGIRRAIEAGAAAVVIKSTNETEAARVQLERADYAFLDSHWRRLDRAGPYPLETALLCRSGLSEKSFEHWLELAGRMDRLAARHDAYLVASLVLADVEQAGRLAGRIEAAGIRVLEVNLGAPHGEEVADGSIRIEHSPARVRAITTELRAAVSLPLWIKLGGQGEDLPAAVEAARDAGADAVTLAARSMALLPDVETMAPLLNTHAAYGGRWALPLTCHSLARSRQRIGPDFPLIGTNGARTGLDIVRFLLAGARAAQMTSAVLLDGFGVVQRSLGALQDYLQSKQLTVEELIGRAADRAESYGAQRRRPGVWRRCVPLDSVD